MAKNAPTANSVNQSSGAVWKSNRYWKIVSTFVRVFSRRRLRLSSSACELLFPVKYLTPWPLMISEDKTAGCSGDSDRFDIFL